MANSYLHQPSSGIKSPKGGAPYDLPLFSYFQKYLFQKIKATFEGDYPDKPEWTKDQIDYFWDTLLQIGYVGIFETKKYGVVGLDCTFSEPNLFYRPKKIIVANPALPGETRTIGQDCVLFTLQETPNMSPLPFHAMSVSVMDIVDYFAAEMALATQALNSNLINSQLAYAFGTDSKAAAEAFKKMFSMISSGEPCVVFDKNLLNEDGTPRWGEFQQNLRQNYIAEELLTTLNSLDDRFNTMVGIPNCNQEKRERLISSEVQANNIEVQTLSDLWLESMNKSCDEVNKMFGVNMRIRKRYNIEEIVNLEEGLNNDVSDT